MPGKPIETLYMMDADDRVIYINTFSNSLSPSIRMGYMIPPMGLIDRYKKKFRRIFMHGSGAGSVCSGRIYK